MTDRIVIAPGRKKPSRPAAPHLDAAWRVVTWLGGVFLAVGLVDLLLSWFPFRLGDPEWEFGTISATLDHLPLPAMGIGFVLAGSLASGLRGLTRTAAITLWTGAGGVVLLALLYALNIPLALGSVEDPVIRLGLKKAVAKTLLQAVFYPAAFIWLGRLGWRGISEPVE